MELSYIEKVDYDFVPYNDDVMAVTILKGEFAGTLYMYHTVSVEEKPNEEDAYLKFDFSILEPENDNGSLSENEKFLQTIGDILVCIMMNEANNGKNRKLDS